MPETAAPLVMPTALPAKVRRHTRLMPTAADVAPSAAAYGSDAVARPLPGEARDVAALATGRSPFAFAQRDERRLVLPLLVSLALHGAALAAYLVQASAGPLMARPTTIPVTLVIETHEEFGSPSEAASSAPVAASDAAWEASRASPAHPQAISPVSEPHEIDANASATPDPSPVSRTAEQDRSPPLVLMPKRKPKPVAAAHTTNLPPKPISNPAAIPSTEIAEASIVSALPVPIAAAGTPNSSPSTEQPSSVDPGYLAQLMASLERHKRYPDIARHRQEQGTVLVAFAIDRAGRVVSLDIRRGSGSVALDGAAEEMIREAEPLPAVPASYRGARLELVFPVTFDLQ